MDFLEKAEKLMMQHKHKLTKPRIQVINYFSHSSKPVSPYDIVKENPEFDVVSVYRTIELLESLWLVHKIRSLGGYVRCDLWNDSCADHCCHEFQVCKQCHTYHEIHGHHKHNATWIDGFITQQHVSEQIGLCSKCI